MGKELDSGCGRATLRSVSAPGIRIIGLAVDQNGPQDSHVLVGDGHQRLVVADAAMQSDDPLLQTRTSERFALERDLQSGTRALGKRPVCTVLTV